MATLNIGGQRIQVDDSFLKLSPEQQNSTVEEIASSLGNSKPEPVATPEAPQAPQKSFLQNAGETTMDANAGLAQGLTLGFGDELFSAGMTPLEMIRGAYNGEDSGKGVGQRISDAYGRALDFNRGVDKTARERSPVANAVGEAGGSVALPASGVSLATNAIRNGAGLGRAALMSAADSGIMGGLYGFGSNDGGLSDRFKTAGEGAIGGTLIGAATPFATAGAGNLISRAITPFRASPTRTALADALANEGVDLTAGQRTGNNALRYAESQIGGNRTQNILDRQGEQYTRAALSRAGENADRATPEVIDQAFGRIGQQFDDLGARNWAEYDPRLALDLQRVHRNYTQLVPESQRAPVVENVLQDIINTGHANGNVMPGEQYQALRSRLDRMARAARNDPQTSDALFGIRNALDDVTERTIANRNPADLGAWREARRQYRNMLVLEKAATGAGENSAAGLISPSQLRNATVQQNRRAYARGNGDFAELARAGEATMKAMPQSGTADRIRAQNLGGSLPMLFGMGLGAGGGAATTGDPSGAIMGMAAGAMLPRVAGRMLMSRPAQAYLGNQVAGELSPQVRALVNALLIGGGAPEARHAIAP